VEDHGIPSDPIRIVLSGGIGSGKSTVARRLAARGAVVVSADELGHRVLEPGGEAFAAVARRWPAAVVEGRIDRRRLAAIVFRDPDELAALEAMTHPAIARRVAAEVTAAGARPVVVELPVLGREIVGGDFLHVLVEAPEEVRLRRVVARGGDPEDAARRIAVQPAPEEWRRWADVVIVNDGDLEELDARVEELWRRLLDP
jgi:dephospho-CoA kinase